MLERRKFLTVLSATIISAALPAGTLAATLRRTGKSGSLRDRFALLAGSDIRLVDAAGVVRQARLVAIDDGPVCRGLEQFSIVFEGTNLTEGLYQIRSWRTGRMLISLQSSGEPGTGRNRQRAYFSNFV